MPVVTLKDVARRAGVSQITASRAFSYTHPVAEETRQRVFQAAEELGYIPDLLARGLVQKHSPIVGMAVMDLANPFITPIIDAAQAVVQAEEHMLVVSQSERRLEIEQASVRQFRQMRVAGVLVMSAAPVFEHLHALERQGTPAVVIARRWDGGDYVTVDDREGGRIAAAHLAGLGHRRIGYLALDEPGNTAVQTRLQGFEEALQEAGVALEPTWRLHSAGHALERGVAAADSFLALGERPTAVFVTSDRLAIGFVHRLRERGVQVPGEVAVVGYDDIRYSEFLEVPLTTVALPKYEMGRLAAEAVFARLRGDVAPGERRQIVLPPALVVRRSCGARRGRDEG